MERTIVNSKKRDYFVFALGKSAIFFTVSILSVVAGWGSFDAVSITMGMGLGIFASYVGAFRYYRASPSYFVIAEEYLKICWGNEKSEYRKCVEIPWNDIIDCTPTSPWVIKTKGKMYNFMSVDKEVIDEIVEAYKNS